MNNFIKEVSIKNFKSIKEIDFKCKRVNVFIGKPNVGKSNLLEALSLYALPMAGSLDINQSIRMNTIRNLFYDNNSSEEIEIIADYGNLSELRHSAFIHSLHPDMYELFLGDKLLYEEFKTSPYYRTQFNIFLSNKGLNNDNHGNYYDLYINNGESKGIPSTRFYSSLFRNYAFNKGSHYNEYFSNFLLPPDGRNLVTILNDNPDLFNEVQGFFEEYGLEMVIDVENNDFEIQKKIDRRVYKYPFELMADTLQRIIFYLTAVESNMGAYIILEEPEVHSFPPYIRILAKRIAANETNQFFVSTHSPYLLNTLIEDTDLADLNIFVTYIEDYQTKVKALSSKEVRDILDDSIDAFFNLDRFINS